MEKRIVMSVDATLRRVYALSALRSYMDSEKCVVPLLTADQRRGLALLAVDAFASLALELMPRVVDLEMPEDETGDLIALTLRMESDEGWRGGVGTALIEEAVAYATLAGALRDADPPLAARYDEKAAACRRGLGAIFDQTATDWGHIAPFN